MVKHSGLRGKYTSWCFVNCWLSRSFSWWKQKYGTFICNLFLKHLKRVVPTKQLSDIVMFDGVSNVQLAGRLLKVYYPKMTVIRGVEHTVYFSNDVYKILILHKIIPDHKMIYIFFRLWYISQASFHFKIKISWASQLKHWSF